MMVKVPVRASPDRQLEQLQKVVQGELATLLTFCGVTKAQATLFTSVDINTVNTPQGKLTAANVNTVNKSVKEKLTPANVNPVSKPCPHCGGAVTGKPTAVYCSDQCPYVALAKRRKTARQQLAKQGGRQ
ncbi:MAG: hypothetical protein NTX45_12665 [Proteobacteria bacterium]|nr:hypothetical protein [Pseudomonadota bacterium]